MYILSPKDEVTLVEFDHRPGNLHALIIINHSVKKKQDIFIFKIFVFHFSVQNNPQNLILIKRNALHFHGKVFAQ